MGQLGFGDRVQKSARCMFHDDSSASFSFYIGEDGDQRWKCHAGCGQGDAIDFLAKQRNLNNSDACRELIRLSGITPLPVPSLVSPSAQSPAQSPFDWQRCIEAFVTEHRAKLAAWRGYSPEFVDWLHGQGLIGLFDGDRIAFPVHDHRGDVVGCHYRLKEDGTWRYYPKNTRIAPFLVGDLGMAKAIYVFESQWDMLATLDSLQHHVQPIADAAFIATRGGSNARILAGLCPVAGTVHAFGQNDTAGQKWLAAVVLNCGAKTFQVVTPSPHKDLNDWTRAGATRSDIETAIAAAQLVIVSTGPDLHKAPPHYVSTPTVVLPDETAETEIAPFPMDALPPSMAGLICATARCAHVPIVLPAICALGVASAAIGAGLEVISGPDRTTSANLMILGTGESGSGKSEGCRPIIAPLIEHQTKLLETWKTKGYPEAQAELASLEAQRKAIGKKIDRVLRGNDPDKAELERLQAQLVYPIKRIEEIRQMVAPTILIDDFTIEALALRLRDNRETIFCLSPEARKPIENLLGRYNPGKTTDESLLLKGYTRESARVDRAKGDALNLYRPCIALCWLVQPDLLAKMMNEESLTASGLLPRLLMCHTKADWVKYDRTRQGISDATRAQWAEMISAFLAKYHIAEKPFRIAATPEAEQTLDHYQHAIYDRRGELADVKLFASRWCENAWRIALVLHAALYGGYAHNHPLGGETAANAVRIMQWFEAAQLDILAKGRHQAAEKVETEVFDLLETNNQRKAQDFITAREVHRARIMPTADAAKALLTRMEAGGLLTGEDIIPARGGKATRVYRAVQNPFRG